MVQKTPFEDFSDCLPSAAVRNPDEAGSHSILYTGNLTLFGSDNADSPRPSRCSEGLAIQVKSLVKLNHQR